jgi:hypothetical protein
MSPTDPEARRLEVLSPEQHALLGRVRQEWLEVGLATGPADRPAAERGVRLAYQAAGLRPPRRVVWLGSPLAGMIAAAMLVVSDLTGHAPDGHWRAVRAQLQKQLQGSLWVQPSLGLAPASQGVAAGRFGTPAGRPVREQVAERVRLAVVGEVSARLGSPAWESLWRVVQSVVLEQVSELAIRLGELLRRVVDPVVAPLVADADEVAAWELPDPPWAVGGAQDPDCSPGARSGSRSSSCLAPSTPGGWTG